MNNPEKLAKYWVYKTNTNNTKTQHDMCWSQLDAIKCKLHSYPDLHLHVQKCTYLDIARNTDYEHQDNENDDMNIRLQLYFCTCLIVVLEYKMYTNKTDHYNITEILLKVALSNITLPLTSKVFAYIDGFILV